MIKKALGLLEDRLKEMRYKNDWNQARAAAVLGIGVRTLRRAESGEHLSERTVYKLEQFLKRQEAA